jgi:hypothetical protein
VSDKRLEYSEKIEELIELIRCTYFHLYNIENCSATIHFSYTREKDFHISFPMKWNFDQQLVEDINNCVVIDLHSYVTLSSKNNTRILYIDSSVENVDESSDKFNDFNQSFNRSIRGIKKFKL